MWVSGDAGRRSIIVAVLLKSLKVVNNMNRFRSLIGFGIFVLRRGIRQKQTKPMDVMEKYKIQKSIEDVIDILDSAPIRRDLILETNVVQLTNRVPIAHLAIERGLKALIEDVSRSKEYGHSLNKLYRTLNKCDAKSGNFLDVAFQDAVKFFRYNVNDKGFGHFRSLKDYLSKVGKKRDFDALRYWAIGEAPKGGSPIPYISPPIHREILCALWCLYLPSRRETVSDRVERKVADAMFSRRHIAYGSDETRKKKAVQWYINWLTREHATRCSALKEAVNRNFSIDGADEFVIQTLRDAYSDLQRSTDPAVQYYLHRQTYLPKRSQPRYSDANPDISWIDQKKTRGTVVTPVGTCLGFVEKYADGAWEIIPQEEGLVQVTDVAESLEDAKAYLVNRLTREVDVTVNGETKQLRIVNDEDFFSGFVWTRNPKTSIDICLRATTYELEFWDGQHELSTGEEISLELPSKRSRRSVSILEGTVVTVEAQKVSIAGTETFTVRDTTER